MKKIVLFLLIAASVFACKNQGTTTAVEANNFGETITEEGAVPVVEVTSLIEGKDSVHAKLSGTVNEVCQKKGCWMTLDMGGGSSMRVRFKDYGFFMPKDASGRTAIIEGWAHREVTPVDILKHYAEDEGQSQAEIDAITEAKEEITFMAHGVIMK